MVIVKKFITESAIIILFIYQCCTINLSVVIQLKMLFGERLKKLREQHNLTQEDLGKALNLSGATINRYEKGLRSPDPETLILLADRFDTSVDYLLGRTEVIKPYQPKEGSFSYIAVSDLPEESRREVEDFVEFVRRKYRQ
jgi:transcriptional regulator with XRE-family HTH domain